jgi:5-methylcytosine-specific restriction endonuclease McrA
LSNQTHNFNRAQLARENREKAKEYLGGRCVSCGTTEDLTFDHIKREYRPLRADGLKDRGHLKKLFRREWESVVPRLVILQLLCTPCHRVKTKKEHMEDSRRMSPAKHESVSEGILYERWLQNRQFLY